MARVTGPRSRPLRCRTALAGGPASLAIGLAAAGLTACAPSSPGSAADDEAAIAAFNRQYLAAINEGDVDALADLTTEDHILMASGGPPTVGKQALVDAMTGAFERFEIDESWSPEETVVSGDLAYQRGTFVVVATPKAGGDASRTTGHFMRIYRRQPGGAWRMVRDMFNSAPAEPACESSGGVDFVCGPTNAEDLVRVPETDWIVSSGMAEGAGFYLIDSASGEWRALETGAEHDSALYPGCDSPPAPAEFESHGLNIRSTEDGAVLYVVGHGAREAIEVFDVDVSDASGPALTWKGCVLMPEGLAANSVASFADGSLVATVLMMPGKTFADSVAMRPTGAVLTWSPGDDGFVPIEGTELPGNNGIEVSADGREIYVVSSGFQTIVAFSNTNPATELRTTEQLPITPDNVHMTVDGRLLTAGMKNDVPDCGGPPGPEHTLERLATCPRGTIVIDVDPATMETEVLAETPALEDFSNATMALPVAGRLWIGTFRGDRVANVPVR